MVKTSIITIGDELLIGQVIDTNSAWIAQQLNKVGMVVSRRVAVGDQWDEIWKALDEESRHSSVILITGGLGPTADDITKPLLCKYFDGNLIRHTPTLEHITQLFENIFKRPITERNLRQAEVPDTCKVLFNSRGTAPGMWFEKEGKIFISMPGVPHEMKGIMETAVIPALANQFSLPFITYRTLVTFGIGESVIADLLTDFESNLPAFIKLAYLPNDGMVRLRLSAIESDKAKVEKAIDHQFKHLQLLMNDYLVATEDEPMQQTIGKMLLNRNQKLSTAESCTGGFIAHLITSIPGSSAYFEGSIVSYSYEAKENLLHVKNKTLIDDGAVSEAVVIEMAKGLLAQLKTDYAIAVSGIMGPDGGTHDKPSGMVWVAVVNNSAILTQKFQFRFDRMKNIQLTAVNALNLLRKFILSQDK